MEKSNSGGVPEGRERPFNRKAFQKRVRERIAAGLPEDDDGDDFSPWVWKILFEEVEAALAQPAGTTEKDRERNLFLAMVGDWTDPVVVRDAPERAADVIRQCLERLASPPAGVQEKEPS